ncbi:dTDP-4-dehydrorhamnose reductase [Rhodopseudomonas palustris]|uniref:dTDP-4-dehydrorhamnose reductase n=1 Tax=Rhodopseudomonas palustris TaxID=1076 RepID=A0A323UEV2_RHOPL|nr:dTDP-4-dehydrorhamnose reductase [Rhodopseudomonas palustris]PZA10727.1 dTDP-4-dehydrorhamnose reductase [Rhodopseudomonas palustris]
MRIVVTGRHGQVAQALRERAAGSTTEIILLARPEIDLTRPNEIEATLVDLKPDAIVNAAAYTAVDQAESAPELAYTINAEGAAAVARAAAKLGAPIVQLSTDYVFDGSSDQPYREDAPTGPLGVYGASKLAGERAVADAARDYAVLRTSWVYAPFGKNFVRTMLALARQRDEVRVVCDQIGAPTSALDIADGVLGVVRNLLAQPARSDLRGIFHMTAEGTATWAEFAEAIFSASRAAGGPSAKVIPIPTNEYPTPARRPANSRLDTSALAAAHGIRLPHWRHSLRPCIERLLAQDAN